MSISRMGMRFQCYWVFVGPRADPQMHVRAAATCSTAAEQHTAAERHA